MNPTAIAALDADVLSIENSKSDAKLLKVFIDEDYPRHIGPGVYDIHSPRVPPQEEFRQRIQEMLEFRKLPRRSLDGTIKGSPTNESTVRPEQLWINPDCGLKTRKWDEVKGALSHLVQAAQEFREKYSKA